MTVRTSLVLLSWALAYAALLLLGLQTKLGPAAAPDLPADDLLERTPLTAPSVAAQSEVSPYVDGCGFQEAAAPDKQNAAVAVVAHFE